MKLGLYLDLRNPSDLGVPWPDHYARWLDRVEHADELGAGEVWLSEHHFYDDGYLPQPLTFAAAIAARTRNIRIGTSVYLLALRNAIQAAEEIAVVDILSNGRLDLGIGVGYRPVEFNAFGLDPSRRYEVLEERVREVRDLWASGRVTPTPVQDPLPFWGGFFGPRGARMSGRLGMGLIAHGAAVRDLMEPYTTALEKHGHGTDSAKVTFAMQFIVAADPDAVRHTVEERQAWQLDSYQRHDAAGEFGPKYVVNVPGSSLTAPAKRAPYSVLTPAEAASVIAESTAGLPVDIVHCWTSPGVLPDAIVDEHIRLLLTEVAPLVEHL